MNSPLHQRIEQTAREERARARAKTELGEDDPLVRRLVMEDEGFPAQTPIGGVPQHLPPTQKVSRGDGASEESARQMSGSQGEEIEKSSADQGRTSGDPEEISGEAGRENVSVSEQLPERRPLLLRLNRRVPVAEPEVFVANKICALVPVEGTELGERFNAGLTRARVMTLDGVYREILKETEVKERFKLFETEFEKNKGGNFTEVVFNFVQWLMENLGCDEPQSMALTLKVAVRRLMADSKRGDCSHGQITQDSSGVIFRARILNWRRFGMESRMVRCWEIVSEVH